MKKYFIYNGSEQIGPFTLEELALKGVNKDTPIWYEGIANWTTAGQVDELKGQFGQVKPPPFIKTLPPPPVQQQILNQPAKRKSYTTTIVVIVLVFLALVGLITISNNPSSIPGVKFEINTPKPVVLSRRADNRKSDIKMRTTVYADVQNQGGNGNVMVVFHLIQGGNKFDRTQSITLNSGETRAVDATFDEVTRLGGDISYSVGASAQ